MIPIRTDYRMRSRPVMNYVIVALNVAIFLLGYNGTGANVARIQGFMLTPQQPQLYQFFTSMFLHQNWMHLAGNMLFLWVFGNAVNDKLRNVGYLAFYLGGGLIAGVGYIMLAGRAPVLGASGAISAVTGAYMILLPRTRVTILFWYFIITTFEVSSLLFLALQFIQNLIMSHPTLAASGGVAYVAHTSGYIYGIIIAFFLLWTHLLERDHYDLLSILNHKRRQIAFKNIVNQGYNPFSTPRKKWVEIKIKKSDSGESKTAPDNSLRNEIAQACRTHNTRDAAEKYLQLLKIDSQAVLSQQFQLDIANQLMADQQYYQAAEAYEKIIGVYDRYEYIADIYLMLGLIYNRYLSKPQKAKDYFQKAAEKLTDEKKLQMARTAIDEIHERFGL